LGKDGRRRERRRDGRERQFGNFRSLLVGFCLSACLLTKNVSRGFGTCPSVSAFSGGSFDVPAVFIFCQFSYEARLDLSYCTVEIASFLEFPVV